MRIAAISDTHNEFHNIPGGGPKARPDDDLVVLAGDIDLGTAGMKWAAEQFPDHPVIYLAGNHEAYGRDLDDTLVALKATANALPNIIFLENDEITFTRDGEEGRAVRILGATLWTDFALYGREHQTASMLTAQRQMNDFRVITREKGTRPFSPADAAELHANSRAWLADRLANRPEGVVDVVVTHHAPSQRAQPEQYIGGALAPAFCNDMEQFVADSGAALWVCGHTHACCDFTLGGTRVVSQQEGYPGEMNHWGDFDMARVDV